MCGFGKVSDAAIVDRARIFHVRCGCGMPSDCCIDARGVINGRIGGVGHRAPQACPEIAYNQSIW